MRRMQWLLLAACLAAGCSKDPATPGTGPQATTGGDQGADGIAKAVPPEAPSAPAGPAPTPAATPGAPAPAAAPVVAATPAAPAKPLPNLWGEEQCASGRALPARHAMNAAAKDAFKQGQAAAAKGDDAGAKAAYDKAAKADPKAFEVVYNLGVLADRAGQVNTALKQYAAALRLQPDYEAAVQGTINVHFRQGNGAAAVSFAQPIADAYERNLHLQAVLADALTRADRMDEAEMRARKALCRDERFVPAMVSLAKASLKRGREELAESVLEQAEKIDPNNAEIHFLHGESHLRKGHLGLALPEFEKAVALRPEYAEARMALGTAYLAGGNYTQALEQFKWTIRLVPTLVAAHLNLGDAYRATSNWTEAKKAFDQALRMQEQLPEAHFNLGLMYMTAKDKFPGMKLTDALNRAILEFTTYRNQMGARLKKDDPSAAYIADIQKQIEREQKRVEREEKQKQKEAERAARKAAAGAEGGGETE
jgi:tetratricopeptide (TPR) repeat protein